MSDIERGRIYKVRLSNAFYSHDRVHKVTHAAIRYNLRPKSVTQLTGKLTVGKTSNNIAIIVPVPNTTRSVHFTGHGGTAEANDCVLLFDKQKQEFVLQPLDVSIQVMHTSAALPEPKSSA